MIASFPLNLRCRWIAMDHAQVVGWAPVLSFCRWPDLFAWYSCERRSYTF